MQTGLNFPTEQIELPSKGLLYSKDSPLSSGVVELRYMSAKEEDILTNQNYIQKGTVIDKLLQSLIVDKNINYEDLLTGDKNALMVAARILGYGKDYEIVYQGTPYTVDLSKVEHRKLNEDLFKTGNNEFSYTLPATETEITFKLLTHRDDKLIDQEIAGLKKIQKDFSAELSTRLKYILTSVGNSREVKDIRQFVDTMLLARDSRALRQYIQEIQPDLDLKFYPEDGPEGGVQIPIGLNFFWPDFNA
jgi:hypothetical protein